MIDGACHEGARARGQLLDAGPIHVHGLPEPVFTTAYLPADYHTSGRAYPLAIFFDGQNMFDDEGSFSGGWQLHRLLDYRACRGERVPIAVAIHTRGWSRGAILSPWSREGGPALGDRMLDWITGSLIPEIRGEVRVEPGPGAVLLGGSSLGGLISLYGFFRHPDAIGRALVMSPALGVGKEEQGPIFGYVRERPFRGGKIYLDAGERECECSGIMRHTGEMAAMLQQKGYRPGHDLVFRPDPLGAHHEESWKHRLPGALSFMCHA